MWKLRVIIFIFVMLSAGSCIERYDFSIKDKDKGVIIESFISNKSFTETLNYPSDGRYFSVILKRTSDVININDQFITHAVVALIDKSGNRWSYTEFGNEGYYYLFNNDFKAEYDQEYQLNITLDSGEEIYSNWEKLPASTTQIGDIYFKEARIQKYDRINDNEKIIENVDGVDVLVDMPKGVESSSLNYQWTFKPMWVFKAAYASPGQSGYQCWVTDKNYLKDYAIQKYTGIGSPKKLFFIRTTGNERIYDYFSVLITQRILSPGYYNFWKEIKDQINRGGLFDEPPYSLQTNFHSNNKDLRLVGYFGVVTEDAVRWVFDKNQLSYFVENDLKAQCDANICREGPCPPPSCSDCTYYIYGDATTQKPNWW